MAWLGLRSLRAAEAVDVSSRAYALPSDLSCSPTALLPHPKIPAGALESETFDRRAWCSRRSRRRKRTKIVIPKGLSWAAKRRALYTKSTNSIINQSGLAPRRVRMNRPNPRTSHWHVLASTCSRNIRRLTYRSRVNVLRRASHPFLGALTTSFVVIRTVR